MDKFVIFFFFNKSVVFVQCIIGGALAESYNVFKYHVGIIRSEILICGGSLIHDKFVLTATRCVSYQNGTIMNAKYVVVAGTVHSVINSGFRDTVVKIYYHMGFKMFTDGTAKHDIAVLKVKNVRFS